MKLVYSKEYEDIKFLAFYADQQCLFEEGSDLILNIDGIEHIGLESVISALAQLSGEVPPLKKIEEYRRVRASPSPLKGDVCTLTVLNYINLVKQMVEQATLKNKDCIDEFTARLGLPFDPDFLLLEIKSGKITAIEPAEGMDKLFCERVSAGREYFICSGLRGVYQAEELLGNTYLFVLNIKKAKFKDLESEGMICCAQNEKSEALRVEVPENTRISVEGAFSIFENIACAPVDLKKGRYTQALHSFGIKDGYMVFKGARVLCGGRYVKSSVLNGEVR